MAVIFPDPESTDEHGLLAAGGNLEPDTLISAYCSGIFPWYSEGQPVLWWCPDPRMVLYPRQFKVSHSLKQTLHTPGIRVTMDNVFYDVINWCSKVERKNQEGTWITQEMIDAYKQLHELGYAHSVETWYLGKLAGGLYGVAIGKVFFGESMFHLEKDASKVALYHLTRFLGQNDFEFIDAQQSTTHLKNLGAVEIPRTIFLEKIRKACVKKGIPGSWNHFSAEQ